MASLGAFFSVAAAPLVKKVLTSLGIGVITYAGLDASFGALKSLLISSYSGLPADVAGLAGLAGFGTGLGIILGALATRIAMMSLSHLGVLTK